MAFEPSVEVVLRSVDIAEFTAVIAASISVSALKLLTAPATLRPPVPVVESMPEMVSVLVASSLNVTVRLSGAAWSRFVPAKLASLVRGR